MLTGTLVNAQTSVEAACLPQWFGGGVPLDGVLSCTMGVPGEAGLKGQGATVREEMPLDGVRKAGVLGGCYVSGADWNLTERGSPEVFNVVVRAEWDTVKEQVLMSLNAC